jgi:hypothetical protein
VWAVRHRRHEQRYGPSPANDYTSGSGPAPRKRFGLFGRASKQNDMGQNPNDLPQHTTPDDVRNSYATEQTRVGSSGYGGLGGGANKYDSPYGNGMDNIPMGRYPKQGGAGYQYDSNGGVYQR